MDREHIERLAAEAAVNDRYEGQLTRVRGEGNQTDCIADAVDGVMDHLAAGRTRSLVIYGDPQSGKTEMMICLTARLLDAGSSTIVHLLNDSVDLLLQSLDRFKRAGLAPSPRNSADLSHYPLAPGPAIVFCKKNARDLNKLITALKGMGPVVIIDDEADYATPNSKVNLQQRTRINELVSNLLGAQGTYIGVTATPARLNLNNTFDNDPETWVQFRPHNAYTGQDHFFPIDRAPEYRLTLIAGPGTPDDTRRAFARFLVTVAHLNTAALTNRQRENDYSFLVHTSGRTADHDVDRKTIEQAMSLLVRCSGADFEALVAQVHREATALYPGDDPDALVRYVLKNASRSSFVVLNSRRDRASAGDKATTPTCPFTVIVGGNIISRGVTFPNLLAMYFTRDVRTRLQQDTYIQRARMFGARGALLPHFELTIPAALYGDWKRCFLFHRLALQAIQNERPSPVWLGDPRISVAAASSIDRSTVVMDKGEMSFQMFDVEDIAALDGIVSAAPTGIDTLRRLAEVIGDAMPDFLIDYLGSAVRLVPGTLAIHSATSVEGYADPQVVEKIQRTKGFIGEPQLERRRFPQAVHHVKIFHSGRGKARVFYKNVGGVQFVQNTANLNARS